MIGFCWCWVERKKKDEVNKVFGVFIFCDFKSRQCHHWQNGDGPGSMSPPLGYHWILAVARPSQRDSPIVPFYFHHPLPVPPNWVRFQRRMCSMMTVSWRRNWCPFLNHISCKSKYRKTNLILIKLQWVVWRNKVRVWDGFEFFL